MIQKKNNGNRPGYKLTTVGWIPSDWSIANLSSVCLKAGEYGANAPAIPYCLDHPRYIRITDVGSDGLLGKVEPKSINIEQGNAYILKDGDFLFARSGATVGKTYLHKDCGQKCAFAGYFIRFVPDSKKILGSYLKAFTSTPKYWYWIKETTRAGAQPNVNATELAALSLALPPLAEQQKIAEILSAWDRALQQLGKLIKAKKQLKKGLAQQLLTGRMRFREFTPLRWQKSELGRFLVFTPRSKPKPDMPYQALGIRSHGKGVFFRTIENPSKVMMDVLYQTKKNDLIVNITFAWEGAIALITEECDHAFVSHRFPTFVFEQSIMLPEYFRYLMLTKRFVHELGLASPGGAGRNRVLSKKGLLKISVLAPTVEEQRKVARTLMALDVGLDALDLLQTALVAQKKALMQKLLTGEVRVKA